MNLGNGLFTNKTGDVSNNNNKFSYVISCDNARLSLYILKGIWDLPCMARAALVNC